MIGDIFELFISNLSGVISLKSYKHSRCFSFDILSKWKGISQECNEVSIEYLKESTSDDFGFFS